MFLLKFRLGELVGCGIKFHIQQVPTRHNFDGPRYPKNKKSSPGRHNSQGKRDCSSMWSESEYDLNLSEFDLSLIECNCQLESWSDWHLNVLTEASTKTHLDEPTHVGEREGKIPHKGCWRSTVDLIWSPLSVKDLSNLVNLLQIWLISIKLAKNPLI